MTFTEALHPRGNAKNAGQFASKDNEPPTQQLTITPSARLAAADEQLHDAQQQMQVAAVNEMLRIAPDGASEIVFELYGEGDPDTELFAFQIVTDDGGDEIEISRELHEFYFDLGSRIDFETAEQHGFVRDGEMFTLDVPQTNPAVTARDLEDAIQLHQFVTFNSTRQRREETDAGVHRAAEAHIRALASQLSAPVDSLILDRGNGVGFTLVRTENTAGEPVHDSTNISHPAFAGDREILDEVRFAASNLRTLGMTTLEQDTTGGPFRLRLNP